eukprot:403350803
MQNDKNQQQNREQIDTEPGLQNSFNESNDPNQSLLKDQKEKLHGLSLQEVYLKIGGFSYFQWWSSTLFTYGLATIGMLYSALASLEKQPKYVCYNEDGTTFECFAQQICSDPNLKYEVDWSAITSLHNWIEDLNLRCESSTKVGLIGSMYFVGWVIAAFILPRMSDFYGRKKIFLLSMFGCATTYMVIIFSRKIELTIALMFILGFFSVGRASVGYLYMQELTPVKNQVIVGSICQMTSGLMTIFICLYFMFISKYWIPFQIFGCSTMFLVTITVWFMPESPKFLISKKRYDEARTSIKFIAWVNRYKGELNFKFDRELQDSKGHSQRYDLNQSNITMNQTIIEDKHSMMETHSKNQRDLDLLKSPMSKIKEEKELTGSLRDLFKIRRHAINLTILVTIWIASSFNYYLINFQLKYIEGDFFINSIVASLVEVPAFLLSGYLYQKLGVKFVLPFSFSVSIVGSILLIIFYDQVHLIPVFILLARFGVGSTFNICYLANSQMFPTIFSGTAFGICNIFAKLATIISPMLAEVERPVPMTVFTILSGLAGFLALFLIKDDSKEVKKQKKIDKLNSKDDAL